MPEGWSPADTWVAAVELFARWRAVTPGTRRRAYAESVERDEWLETNGVVEDLVAPGTEALDAAQLKVIVEVVNTPGQAHAAALALDVRCSAVWPEMWWRQLGRPSVWRPRRGDPFPVSDSRLPIPPGRWSTRVGATGGDIDDLPHLRYWAPTAGDDAGLDVVFRFDENSARAVRAAVADGSAATLHPNAKLDELRLPGHPDRPEEGSGSGSVFPVEPVDPAAQRDTLIRLLGAAVDDEVSIVVGCETSLTAGVAADVQRWLDDHPLEAPAIVVAGSLHTFVGDEPANIACWLAPNEPARVHRKVAPFISETTAGTKVHEGIVPGRRLEVWCAGWARFAVVICRDLLDPTVYAALAQAGVNLVAVPSFSDNVADHEDRLRALVGVAQTRGVCANGPTDNVEGTAIFSQPVERHRALATGPADGRGVGWADHRVRQFPRWHTESSYQQ